MSKLVRLTAVPVLSFALLGLVACGDDDPSAPQPEFTFEPVLSELWPSEDGTAGNFSTRGVERELPDLAGYGAAEDVPPLPTFDEIYKSLHGSQGAGTTRTGSMTLTFDGMHDYLPGVQVLQSEFSGGVEPPVPFGSGEALWKLEDDRVAGYVEWQANPSWIYLTSDLDPGDGFTQTLFEAGVLLWSDVTLEGRVWRHFQLPWDGREISCVEVLYLLDRGITEFQRTVESDPEYFNDFTYGSVVYGQGIGPMSWREKTVTPPFRATQDLPPIPAKSIDAMMTLESVDLVAPASALNLR